MSPNKPRWSNDSARKSNNKVKWKPKPKPSIQQKPKLKQSVNTKSLKPHPRNKQKSKNTARTHTEIKNLLPVQDTIVNTKSSVNNILNQEWREKFRNIELSNSELINFTAMIYAESNNQWPKWQAAVGYVILNRMRFWKQNMNEVLFTKKQFSPVADGNFTRAKWKITEQHVEYARKILNGEVPNPIGNATFFQTKGADRKRGNWQRSARTLTNAVAVGDHVFRTERKFA